MLDVVAELTAADEDLKDTATGWKNAEDTQGKRRVLKGTQDCLRLASFLL